MKTITNFSYHQLVLPQLLVKIIGEKDRGVGFVDESSQYRSSPPVGMEYHVVFRDGEFPFDIVRGEGHLRGLSFREFLFYRDPHTGGLKIGFNKALVLLYGQVVAMLCTWAFFAYGSDGGWGAVLGWIAATFSVTLPIGVLINTYVQWLTWKKRAAKWAIDAQAVNDETGTGQGVRK